MIKVTSIILGFILTHCAFAGDSKEIAIHAQENEAASLSNMIHQSYQTNPAMDELVKNSIHDDDRRFAHVG